MILKRVILHIIFVSFFSSNFNANANEINFKIWLEELKIDALSLGVNEELLTITIDKLSLIKDVVKNDRQQSEFTNNFTNYLNKNISNNKINYGRKVFKQNRRILKSIENDYGVPARYIIAFWGIETNFGQYMGSFNVPNSLTTLAFDPRRSNFFRKELLNAIIILDQKHTSFEKYRGSWAGASGHMQFMPSTFLNYAVDYNNDGKKDVWKNLPDAFASAANYLSSMGWQKKYTWGREVIIPGDFNYSDAQLSISKPISEWKDIGIIKTNGQSLPNTSISGSILLPSGKSGPAFLVYDNFNIIMQWNKSIFYALTVGYLADRIVNINKLHTKLTSEKQLTLKNIRNLQKQLKILGYNNLTIDGIIGFNTKNAIRVFQIENELPADGYPDRDTLEAIKQSTKRELKNIE